MLGGEWTLWVPSNWANVINFVVFDVLLITCVFALTADVTGRLNDAALRDGKPRPLYLLSPPLIGGGLCGTHAGRVRAMAAIRIGALLFALLSNLCIEGGSKPSHMTIRAKLLVPGTMRNYTADEFSNALILRAGCQSAAPDGSLVYGELRVAESDETECITDLDLLIRPVTFSVSLERIALDTGKCKRRLRGRWPSAPRLSNLNELYDLRCERATLACYVIHGSMINNTCRGLVRSGDAVYLCDNGAVEPETFLTNTTCRRITNVDWKCSYWMDALFLSPIPISMIDAFHSMSVAGKDMRFVYQRIEKPYTTVKYMWAVVVLLKMLLVAGVFIASLILRRAGMRTVVNDERGLAELLRNAIDATALGVSSGSLACSRSERSAHSENSVGSDIFLDMKQSVDGRKVIYVKGAPNKDPNEEIHKEEEMYW